MTENGYKIRRLVYIALMTAMLEAVKFALNSIPNVEMVTLLVIIFTRQFGWKMTLPATLIFAFIECTYWGFGIWTVTYFYMWPLLVYLTHLNRKADSFWTYVILAAAFGLGFGAFCSLTTLMISGVRAAFVWWIAGIPYDLIHGAANFVICLLLFRPLNNALEIMRTKGGMAFPE